MELQFTRPRNPLNATPYHSLYARRARRVSWWTGAGPRPVVQRAAEEEQSTGSQEQATA